MNNTDKLLRAFIEASGYEIEEVYSVYTNVSDVLNYTTSIKPCASLSQGDWACRVDVDYKVTKKVDPLDVLYDGVTLRQLINHIIDISCNPTLPDRSKWIEYPEKSFDAIINHFGDKAEATGDDVGYEVLGVGLFMED